MADGEADLLLEKLEAHVGRKFPTMFLDYTEAGPRGILHLEYMKSYLKSYGEYSEMTPYISGIIDASESAIYGTASIGGKMRNSFLIKKHMVYQQGLFTEAQPQNKGGLLSGFLGGGDKNKDQQQQRQAAFGQ